MTQQDWINNEYKISQLSDDYKDYYENCLEYINSLEQELSELTMKVKAQDIIIRDKTALIEAMSLQLKILFKGKQYEYTNNVYGME